MAAGTHVLLRSLNTIYIQSICCGAGLGACAILRVVTILSQPQEGLVAK